MPITPRNFARCGERNKNIPPARARNIAKPACCSGIVQFECLSNNANYREKMAIFLSRKGRIVLFLVTCERYVCFAFLLTDPTLDRIDRNLAKFMTFLTSPVNWHSSSSNIWDGNISFDCICISRFVIVRIIMRKTYRNQIKSKLAKFSILNQIKSKLVKFFILN